MTLPSEIFDFARTRRLDPRIVFACSSVRTCVARSGLIVPVPANEPSFDHDPATGQALGLSIWGFANNGARSNTALDDAANWTVGSPADAAVTANATRSPAGDVTMDRLSETSMASAVHEIYQATIGPAWRPALTTCLSVFVARNATSPCVELRVNAQTVPGNSYFCAFDAQTGEVGTPAASGGGSVSGAGADYYREADCYRFWVAGLPTGAGPGAQSRIALQKTLTGGTVYAGDLTGGASLWGAQLDVGLVPTPLVYSTTGSVARFAETASVPVADLAFATLANTLLVEAMAPVRATVGVRTLLCLDDGTANNQILLQANAGSLSAVMTTGGVQQANLALGTLVDGEPFTVALTFRENDIAGCFNGGTVPTDTSATLPTVTTLRFGSDQAAANHWNGSIGRVLLWPARLPDSELQRITGY